jgi:2-oxoglutarate ferredoxin oxidoreductase subunit alpha
MEAFNIAEEIRGPVFLVMDKELSMTRERVDLSRLVRPKGVERPSNGGQESASVPHAFSSPSQIPPFSRIGGDHPVRYTTSTHDHAARLTTDPETIQRFIDHFVAKIEDRRERLARVSFDPEEGAEILVISYGITARSAREAVREARRRNRRASHLMVHSIWPVPEKAIREAAAGVRRVIVPEMNMGQYLLEVQRVLGPGVEVAGVQKMDTTLISPEEILAEMR